MEKQSGFGLMCDTFRKSRVAVNVLSPQDKTSDILDYDFEKPHLPHDISIDSMLGGVREKVLYRFRNSHDLSYIAFFLNWSGRDGVAVIGPYLYEPLSSAKIFETGERLALSPKKQKALADYFSSVPVLDRSSHLFTLLDTFCERAWGAGYEISDIDQRLPVYDSSAIWENHGAELDDTFISMKNMEQRYDLENEMMTAVTMGAENKVNQIFSGLNENVFEKRAADPLRNIKNYCIIMNTLLRKAAERGAVHPIYIDRISTDFALRIERVNTIEQTKALMTEMFGGYCRLVNKHSSKKYSPLVQKAVVAIESDLSAELGLHSLARHLRVSDVYLSSVFKKETGKTITEYIREKRLSYAIHLLKTTGLQIQTVALHCGMMDVHYFSKLFKKYTGKTPSEFRREGT